MGQREILEFLKQNKQYYSTMELSRILDISRSSVSRAIRRLRKIKIITDKEIPANNGTGHKNIKYKARV